MLQAGQAQHIHAQRKTLYQRPPTTIRYQVPETHHPHHRHHDHHQLTNSRNLLLVAVMVVVVAAACCVGVDDGHLYVAVSPYCRCPIQVSATGTSYH